MEVDTLVRPGGEPAATGKRGATLLANAPDGIDALFLAERLGRGKAPTWLHILRDGQRLPTVARLVRFFAPAVEIVPVPAWDCLPYDRVSPTGTVMAERLAALARLARGPGQAPRLILTTANAIVQLVPPPAAVTAAHLTVRAGQRVDREALIAFLDRNGYRRAGAVADAGEYAVRGGLLDVFPSGAKRPVRLDFFGTTLETIRTFDPLSQRTADKVADDRAPADERGPARSRRDRAVQGPLSPAVRRRRRRSPVRGGGGGAQPSRAWSTGCPCSTRTSCRSQPISSPSARSASTIWRWTRSRRGPP